MTVYYPRVIAAVAAFVAAYVIVRLAGLLVHRLLKTLEIVEAQNRDAVHARARQMMRALTVLAYSIAALASVSLALERFGVNEPAWNPRQLMHWLLVHGVNIGIILVGAFVVTRAANLAIDNLQFRLARSHADTDFEWQRRAATLGRILGSLVTATVGFVVILMLLRELSIDVLPILTGAGIAGLAIGFGAQNLVRDVISGFFLILEDQVRIGDIARINGVGGTVEQINLRTIVLRDGEGAVQVFPNGTITTLANLSKQYAYAIVDMKVVYHENIDRVIGTMREVGATMEKDPVLGSLLLAPLEVSAVESLADGFATIRARFKTLPLNQGKVANEMRRRLMTAFVGRGIKPYG
ncbi:MAG TPA: mechanosensitive ion channel domain-containing protein [Vicinamibacterales bacterium]|nr:mechanosensitive ion channel domain-containing protein [Vicinamibacterales bacterium]